MSGGPAVARASLADAIRLLLHELPDARQGEGRALARGWSRSSGRPRMVEEFTGLYQELASEKA